MKYFTTRRPILFALCLAAVPSHSGALTAAYAQDAGTGPKYETAVAAPLSSLPLPNTTITTAMEYPAGANPVPAPQGTTGAMRGPLAVSICRVAGTIKPAPVSNIRFGKCGCR